MAAINLTFQYTEEFANEVIANAGGRGTNDETEMAVANSRSKHCVLVGSVANFIEGMAQRGYRVVDVEIPKAPDLCRTPSECAGLGYCPREIACND